MVHKLGWLLLTGWEAVVTRVFLYHPPEVVQEGVVLALLSSLPLGAALEGHSPANNRTHHKRQLEVRN